VTRRDATATGPTADPERLRDLVGDLDVVIWEADAATGRFTFVSEGATDILGYAPEALIEDPDLWADRLHPADRDGVLREFLAETAGPHAHDLEYRFERPDGGIVWLRGIGHAVTDGRGTPIAVRGLMIDITRRKLAELPADPERERSAGVADPRESLLSAVSHDLRSPLAAILGLAVTLERQDLDAGDSKDLAARIAANARRLDRMVTDLIDLERLARGKATLALLLVDVGALARRVVGDAGSVAGREVRLATGESLVAEVDGSKVERIVEALLDNAARRSAAGDPIRVAVRAESGGVLIEVEDGGPVLSAGERRDAFRAAHRPRSTGASAAGETIGLALVGGFAELHGGRASIEGHEAATSFRVWLPCRPPHATRC
jgi:PAS domain S-box-containing protein